MSSIISAEEDYIAITLWQISYQTLVKQNIRSHENENNKMGPNYATTSI
jgi:hypothetical protein